MKNWILFIILFTCFIQADSYARPVEKVYDSTSNFVGSQIKLLINQILYLRPLDDDLKANGYHGFIINPKKAADNSDNIYRKGSGDFSKYDHLAGTEFKILDVVKLNSTDVNYSGEDDYILSLQNLKANESVYYIYHGAEEHAFPFIVKGYYEKQKQIALGKKYIFREDMIATAVDLKTGVLVLAPLGTVWVCEDIKLDNPYYALGVVFSNTQGDKIMLHHESTIGFLRYGKSFTVEEAAYYQKKYSDTVFNKILKGMIEVGMTEDICELVKGIPKEKKVIQSKTGNKEVWIYMDQTITMQKGKIIAIK